MHTHFGFCFYLILMIGPRIVSDAFFTHNFGRHERDNQEWKANEKGARYWSNQDWTREVEKIRRLREFELTKKWEGGGGGGGRVVAGWLISAVLFLVKLWAFRRLHTHKPARTPLPFWLHLKLNLTPNSIPSNASLKLASSFWDRPATTTVKMLLSDNLCKRCYMRIYMQAQRWQCNN